ncbi:MAG: sugar phosphate isomerase/epimerase [Parasporobacterium sp.]|nr:sugar phosphate isomerase/epimerase [Parasporobacterium sp.]
MNFGLHSAILPDLTFEEVVDYASAVGFKCLEVCCWPVGKAVRRYAGVTHINLNESDNDRLAYYKKYAEDKGIEIAALGYYPNAMDADREAAEVAQKHIVRMIDAAAEMKVKTISTFVGKDKTQNIEANLDLFEKIWTPIVRHAEDKDVKIAIENCPMLYTKDEWPGGNNLACAPYIWRQMYERIDSDHLGIAYDPSHPYLQQGSVTAPIYEFRDKIFHVHFKDIKIYPEKVTEYGVFSYPGLWHSPKLPGLGGVDFAAFISALNDIRYTGSAVIEVEDKAFENSLEDTKSGIEQAYRFLKQYL